jgi:hypothetical protein
MKLNHCTVEFKKKEEEKSNLAAQHYGVDETNIRRLKKQKEQLYTVQKLMLRGRTVLKKSDHDFGHPGPSDGQ